MYFFNNSKTFDHAKAYGITDAFFDLATTGFQATLATNVSRGDTCVVATKDADGQVRFTSYSLARVETVLWKDGTH